MNIILCGFPRSGKTPVGRLLAKSLGLPFVDSDALIEEREGLSCRDLYTAVGEALFREKEREALALLAQCRRSVIALGGGALLDRKNALYLKGLGTLLYLKADKEQLRSRLEAMPCRAVFLDFESFYEGRRRHYEEHADGLVEMGELSAEQIVQTIIERHIG